VSDDLFEGPAAMRLAVVEDLGLDGEERLAGLVSGAGYPEALDPIVAALVGVTGPVLDVGAGLGAASVHLGRTAGVAVIGVEPEDGTSALARRAFPGLPMVSGEVGAIPVRASSCGGVTLLGTLSLVADLDGALAELARVLTAGGRLAITDLCLDTGEAQRSSGPNVFRSVPALVEGLARHGLVVDESTTSTGGEEAGWDATTARVDAEIEARFGRTATARAWREDRARLRRLIEGGELERSTLLATAHGA